MSFAITCVSRRVSRLVGGKRQRPLFAPCLLMMRCNSPEPQLFVTQLLMCVFRDVQPLNMPGMGMSCYITGPPFEKWHFVGAITNDSPSGVFRVRWPKVDLCSSVLFCFVTMCSRCARALRTYNTHMHTGMHARSKHRARAHTYTHTHTHTNKHTHIVTHSLSHTHTNF